MSCLFDSLSIYLVTDDSKKVNSNQLRQEICSYLERNPKLMDDVNVSQITKWESNTELGEYISKMRMSSTWGGAVEILCFCNMYNSNVIVHHQGREIEFKSKEKSNNNIHLNYNGCHFTPIKLEIIN